MLECVNTNVSMKEYQQRHMIPTLVYSRVTMVILFLLIVLLARSVVELNNKRITTARLQAESAEDRKELEEKVRKAELKTASIKTERGMEAYIRSTYPVVENGEGVIVVYDTSVSPVTPVREDMTFWESLLIWWRNVVQR